MKRDKDERAKVPEGAVKAFEHKAYTVDDYLKKAGIAIEKQDNDRL